MLPIDGMSEDVAKNHMKKIAKELASFGASLEEIHKENPAKTRTLKSLESPADVLACDGLIQTQCDKHKAGGLQYIDRNDFVKKFLGYLH